jgi:hypothetical protein
MQRDGEGGQLGRSMKDQSKVGTVLRESVEVAGGEEMSR